jgi:putative peptidoglycan lipid II flippase
MSLARRAFTVSSWTLVSRILGLIRDRLFAGLFGASLVLDAFLVAFQLPNLLRNLFGEGALSAAFIPRYVQMRAKSEADAELFAGAVLTRLFLGLSVLAGVAMIAAALAIPFLSDRYALVAYLAIPQLPFLSFICVSAIMAGVLNGRRHFIVPAAAPVVLNLCLIGTVFLDPEQEIWYLPYAVLVAGISQVILHGWALKKTGGVPPLMMRSSPEVAELRRSVLPVLISSSIFQFNVFLDTIIAYVFLGVSAPGAVAILYFGNRLLQFPMALITHGVGTAAYPDLADAAKDGWHASGEGLRKATSMLWFFLLPAAVGLLVTAEPLVRTIYQTGSFGDESVRRTILVTQFLALALIPISLCKLQARAFHAHRDQRTPMRVSLFTVLVNLCLNVFLVQTPLREAGLALATAISSTLGCAIYAVLLNRRGAGSLLTSVAYRRPLVPTLVMGAAVWALLHYWQQPSGGGSLAAALRLLSAVGLGAALYFGIAHFLKSETQERP